MPISKNMLFTLPDSYVVVDLETTGLDAKWDSIIEMAAIKVENGSIVASYESLVNPGYEIDDFITELTGITNDMLSSAPTLEQVLPDFLALIQSDVMLGHYLCFDVRFLKTAAETLGLSFEKTKYVETLRIARKVFPEWRHHRLCDLVENLHIESAGAHRAMLDVLATKASYDALRAIMDERGMTVEDIKPNKHANSRASNVAVQLDAYQPDEDIEGKTFVFTGAMERMTRKEGMQKVVNAGGYCGDNVTKETNFLVLGNKGYSMALSGGKSSKHKKAELLKLKGADIEVISEDVFLQMLEPNE